MRDARRRKGNGSRSGTGVDATVRRSWLQRRSGCRQRKTGGVRRYRGQIQYLAHVFMEEPGCPRLALVGRNRAKTALGRSFSVPACDVLFSEWTFAAGGTIALGSVRR